MPRFQFILKGAVSCYYSDMLKSTAKFLIGTHMFFDEIGYEPNSENFDGDELFDCLVDTINHAKAFEDAIAVVRMYDDYLKHETKFLRKYEKYPEFWDAIEYCGREEIAVVDDKEAVGGYYITNIFNSDYKSINVFGQSFGDKIYSLANEGGYFSLGGDAEYFLRFSKMSSPPYGVFLLNPPFATFALWVFGLGYFVVVLADNF